MIIEVLTKHTPSLTMTELISLPHITSYRIDIIRELKSNEPVSISDRSVGKNRYGGIDGPAGKATNPRSTGLLLNEYLEDNEQTPVNRANTLKSLQNHRPGRLICIERLGWRVIIQEFYSKFFLLPGFNFFFRVTFVRFSIS
jgi:hypothetical protein